MASTLTIILSLIGGILPALLWLWFWRKEDVLHPEPRRKVALVFLGGMLSVLLVLPVEKIIYSYTGNNLSASTITLWALAEELFKFIVIYFVAFRSKDMDEPLDAVIYMITGALGFSALENTFFLYNLVGDGLFTQSIITGNMRFLGATLLHTASSATIGIFYGLAFFKSASWKKVALFTGIAASIVLHTIFNLLIINSGKEIFFIFAGIWVIITLLMVVIEKVKKVHSERTNLTNQTYG